MVQFTHELCELGIISTLTAPEASDTWYGWLTFLLSMQE